MPLGGSLDVGPRIEGAPELVLDDDELRIENVEVLQVIFEVRTADLEAMLPPALNPTLPLVVSFLAYRAAESPYGPFSLVQTRLSARAGVRPRAFLVSACCDNATAAEALGRSRGYRIQPAAVTLRPRHHRVDCTVVADRRTVLDVALLDPEPITGHDIQYPPGMHLAVLDDGDGPLARAVQVESEYEFLRADRGRPELRTFDARWWGDDRIRPVDPVSASFTACHVTMLPVRYVCNPDLPAHEGTVKVGAD
jgi:hypothetical protein